MALVDLLSGGQGRHKADEILHVQRRGHGERCRGLNRLEDSRFYWSQMFFDCNIERAKAKGSLWRKKEGYITHSGAYFRFFFLSILAASFLSSFRSASDLCCFLFSMQRCSYPFFFLKNCVTQSKTIVLDNIPANKRSAQAFSVARDSTENGKSNNFFFYCNAT